METQINPASSSAVRECVLVLVNQSMLSRFVCSRLKEEVITERISTINEQRINEAVTHSQSEKRSQVMIYTKTDGMLTAWSRLCGSEIIFSIKDLRMFIDKRQILILFTHHDEGVLRRSCGSALRSVRQNFVRLKSDVKLSALCGVGQEFAGPGSGWEWTRCGTRRVEADEDSSDSGSVENFRPDSRTRAE